MKGDGVLLGPPCPTVMLSSAWELGAVAVGSGSVKERGSGGTVMAAGSSPALQVPGSTGVRRGHQRTVSTQQPLVRKLPDCPISVQLPPW